MRKEKFEICVTSSQPFSLVFFFGGGGGRETKKETLCSMYFKNILHWEIQVTVRMPRLQILIKKLDLNASPKTNKLMFLFIAFTFKWQKTWAVHLRALEAAQGSSPLPLVCHLIPSDVQKSQIWGEGSSSQRCSWREGDLSWKTWAAVMIMKKRESFVRFFFWVCGQCR